MNYVESFSNVPSGSDNQLTRQEGWNLFFKGCAEQWFDIASSEGIDPIIIMSWAINESDWGTSNISCDKANLWGWGAVDGDAYDSAKDYSNGIHKNAAGAMEGLKDICHNMYINVTDSSNFRYQRSVEAGYEPDTLAGVGVWYASDPNWGANAVVWMKHIYSDFIAEYCSGGDFLAVAQRLHQYIAENQFFYPTATNIAAGSGIENTGTSKGSYIPPKNNYIDCSGYVTWVLVEYGYTELTGWQQTTYSIPNLVAKYGWTIKPASEAVPGDILLNTNHTEIYAGNGQFYNAGSTNAIREPINNYGESHLNSFTYAITVTPAN